MQRSEQEIIRDVVRQLNRESDLLLADCIGLAKIYRDEIKRELIQSGSAYLPGLLALHVVGDPGQRWVRVEVRPNVIKKLNS